MTKRIPNGDVAAHTLFSFLHDWAASGGGTSYSEQTASGSFRRIEFRLTRENGEHASLELVASSDDGQPAIDVRVANFNPFASDAPRPQYPSWQVAIDSIRRLRDGPMSHALFAPEASAIRQDVAKRYREGIARLPEPTPVEILEFLRALES